MLITSETLRVTYKIKVSRKKKSILPVLEQWTRRTLSNLDPQKCTAQTVSTDAHSSGLKQNRRVSNKNVEYMIMHSTFKLVVSK